MSLSTQHELAKQGVSLQSQLVLHQMLLGAAYIELWTRYINFINICNVIKIITNTSDSVYSAQVKFTKQVDKPVKSITMIIIYLTCWMHLKYALLSNDRSYH